MLRTLCGFCFLILIIVQWDDMLLIFILQVRELRLRDGANGDIYPRSHSHEVAEQTLESDWPEA